jgi:hypothetical protein
MASENENSFTPGITGNISDPQVTTPSDPANITPFYGETQLQDNVINFPINPVSPMPAGQVAPMIGSPGNNIVAPPTKSGMDDYIRGTLADFDSTEGKNNYAKIYSYDSGPSSNAFYDRYAAFGEEKLREVGFSPIRDNESNFNANTTWWDNTSRMLSHSFFPLAGLGFKTGIKSLGKMLQGDFTSADLDEAKEYEYYSALGQDSRGGAGAFFNNTFMNFGYTAGIMTEAVIEEMALSAATTLSGGALGGLQAARTGSLLNRLGKVGKMGTVGKGFKNTLQSLGNVNTARSFWKNRNVKTVGNFLNPLENTVDAIKGIRRGAKQGENLTGLAKGFKTAGGFYRDIRNINMAVAEARLESGMVINSTYDEGYRDFYKKTGRAPDNQEQRFIRAVAEKKGLETFNLNAGLIYASNKVTFSNITRPKGGLSNFMRNTREELYDIGGGKFGNYGKILYDNTKKAFAFEKNNLKNLAKSWWKNPGFKTAKETVVYFKGNFMEGLQENAQEAIARANEESAKSALESALVKSTSYSNAVNAWTLKDQAGIEGTSWSEYKKELGKEFSARGFETFASGFLMGTFAKPLNGAIPFLSTQYNRMFNKADYGKWVKQKKFVSESLVEQLNNVDINDFLNSRIVNLGTQSNIANAKASQSASTKENFDTENESFISAVSLMNQTKSTAVFVDKLKSMQELTDEELLDAIPGDTKEKAGYYRERLQKSINKIEAIEQRFEKADEMFPNPVPTLEGLDKTNTYEYNAQVALHHAWNKAVENFVFFNESFENVTERMSTIQDTYMQDSNIGQSDYGAAKVLFDPMQINQQQTILDQEIDTEQQKNNPDRNRINALKEQKKSLENYKKAFSEFRKFYIRDDFRPQARQILQAEKGEAEVTQQEVDDYINSELGPLDDQQKQSEIIRNLKSSHHNYLRAVAKGVNTTVLDSALDDGFNKLTDYYKLGQESRQMSKMINILHDPAGFLEVVDKNQKWMKRLYDKRSEYYTRLVNEQVSMVENNAFLNQLADQGLYVSADDFAQYVKDGTLPSEIFNDVDKVVYKKGTPEYEQIYREFFIPYENLKNLTVEEAALANDDIYKAKVADINKMYDEKIASLPLEDTKVTLAEFPAKKGQTYKLNDLVKDLEGGQYIQAVYDENQDPVIFYKDAEGNLRFIDESGEIVDVKKLNKEFSYLSAEIYNIQSLPNQNTVKLINQQRDEELERITQEYLENEDSAEVRATPTKKTVVYTTDSDIASMPAELRNALFVEFDKTLTPEQRDTLTEDQQENLFDKFVKQGNFTVKKIIDDYNQKQEAKAAVKGEGLKKDFEFKFNGKTINTKDKDAPTLRAIQTRMKLQVESLEEKKTRTLQEDENIKYLKIQIKNLEGVINSRIRSGFSPEQQAAIDKIQELKSKQPKYRVESDGYYIEGKGKDPYSRVTSVINQFLGDYTYKDKEKVQAIFDRTLGQDITAIDAFIDEINKAGISGVEPYTLRELKVRLPKALEEKKLNVEDPFISTEGSYLLMTYSRSELFTGANDGLNLNNTPVKVLKNEGYKLEKDDFGTNIVVLENLETGEQFTVDLESTERTKIKTSPMAEEQIKLLEKQETTTATEERLNKLRSDLKNAQGVDKNLLKTDIKELENKLERLKRPSIVKIPESLEGVVTPISINGKEYTIFDNDALDRQATFVKIDGKTYGFYRSSTGTSGKEAGNWYPFYGLSTYVIKDGFKSGTKEWVYNSEASPELQLKLKEAAEKLNKEWNAESLPSENIPYLDMTEDQLNEMFGLPIDKNINYRTNTEARNKLKKYVAENGLNIKDVPATETSVKDIEADIEKRRKKSFGRNSYGSPSIIFNYSTDSGYVGTYYASDGTETIIEAPTEKEVRDELKTKYNAELAALGTTETSVKDAAVNLVGELTYESSRITGNYVDQAVKDLFDKGTVPEFNENQISREAYDNLFGSEGMLTELKRRVDNGELYIASTGIVVYDDALRIAGEIDLLVADRKGNITIVDIKTGQSSKWNGFFKKGNKFSKLQNYGLQQTAYANLLNRMVGVDANIALLPIQITKSTSENTDGKIESAQRPSSANLLSSEYLIDLNKADFAERINSVIPLTTAPSADTSLSNKLGETESSDEQDNDALKNALKQPIKDVKMTKSEVKVFNELKSQIAKAKSMEDIDTVNRNIMIAELQGEIPTEAVSELNNILEAAKAGLDTGSNFGAPSITLTNIKVGSEVIAKLDIIKTKGKSKGDIFVEKDGIVKVSKIDGNKITVKSNDGSVMTFTLDQINDNYLSNDTLNNPKSFEQNVTREEENFGKETTTSTSELLANDAKLKEINNSNITAKQAEDNLLDDLDC